MFGKRNPVSARGGPPWGPGQRPQGAFSRLLLPAPPAICR